MTGGVTLASGVSGLGAISSVSGGRFGNRLCLIGDSLFAFGYLNLGLSTSAGTVAVSNGIATITVSGNARTAVGNYVYLVIPANADPTYADALNGAYVPVLSVSSNSIFTVSATFGGATMPSGDYSAGRAGTGWSYYNTLVKKDSALVNWLRSFKQQDPFILTNFNASIGQFSSAYWNDSGIGPLLTKCLAGPAFDIALINLGENDLQVTPAATASAAAVKLFRNVTGVAQTLLNNGKSVVVFIPNPDLINNTNSLPKAEALAQYRSRIINWARRRAYVYVIDTYSTVIDGTLTTGLAQSNYVNGGDNHITTYGCYQLCKNQPQMQATLALLANTPQSLLASVTDDNSTYSQAPTAWAGNTAYTVGTAVANGVNCYICTAAGTSAASGGPTGTSSAIVDGTVVWQFISVNTVNYVSHGGMDGTGGSNNSASVFNSGTPTVPTGWTILSGSTLQTGSGSTAAQTLNDGSKQGLGWQLSCVASAAGQVVTLFNGLSSLPPKGGWYRVGMRITALGSWAALVNSFSVFFVMGGGTMYCEVHATDSGNNTTTYPLVSGDYLQFESEPFWIDAAQNASANSFQVVYVSAAAGTVPFELSRAYLRAVDSPVLS